jgi:V8-like Glu-specific endopeptidase
VSLPRSSDLVRQMTRLKPGDHFANAVVLVGEGRVQYLTDTLPGSSGSPVFDADWNVVALHHSGGWLKEPNAASKTT